MEAFYAGDRRVKGNISLKFSFDFHCDAKFHGEAMGEPACCFHLKNGGRVGGSALV
jgi:hypothetical protein